MCQVSIYPFFPTEAKRAETKGIRPECVFTLPQRWKKAREDAAAYTRAGGAEKAAGLVSETLTAVLSWLHHDTAICCNAVERNGPVGYSLENIVLIFHSLSITIS